MREESISLEDILRTIECGVKRSNEQETRITHTFMEIACVTDRKGTVCITTWREHLTRSHKDSPPVLCHFNHNSSANEIRLQLDKLKSNPKGLQCQKLQRVREAINALQ